MTSPIDEQQELTKLSTLCLTASQSILDDSINSHDACTKITDACKRITEISSVKDNDIHDMNPLDVYMLFIKETNNSPVTQLCATIYQIIHSSYMIDMLDKLSTLDTGVVIISGTCDLYSHIKDLQIEALIMRTTICQKNDFLILKKNGNGFILFYQ